MRSSLAFRPAPGRAGMRPGTLGDDAARVVLLMAYRRSAIRRTAYPADRDTSPAPSAGLTALGAMRGSGP
ncbi:hypothetical protein ABZU75_18055 [Streptosporangium sp. NPDC005286]|uniref:hypothetical protein n=1 Tax=Streptosporangium sp. NPDC005286 TaxID=3154463 RepID=UPI0033A782B2